MHLSATQLQLSWMKNLLLVLLMLVQFFNTSLLAARDLVGPEIHHDLLNQAAASGENYLLQIRVTDDQGVGAVVLHFRNAGATEFQPVSMQLQSQGDVYSATISADTVQPPGIEYYIVARDLEGNSVMHGFSFDPLVIKVEPPVVVTKAAATENKADSEKSGTKWLWVGLSVLAAGAVVSALGGDDGPPPARDTGDVVISAPVPR